MTFTRKDLFMWPFNECKLCGERSFGRPVVLGYYGQNYTPECWKCWYNETYKLPKLKKMIIYLDQCAISNIMKSIAAHDKWDDNQNLEIRYQIYTLLKELNTLQLITCPYSEIHEYESILQWSEEFFEKIKQTYQLLSQQTSFKFKGAIESRQIYNQFIDWLRDWEGVETLKSEWLQDEEKAIENWVWHITLTIDIKWKETDFVDLNTIKNSLDSNLVAKVPLWSKESWNFKDILSDELQGYRKMLLSCVQWVYWCVPENRKDFSYVHSMICEFGGVLESMKRELIKEDYSEDKHYTIIVNFINSDKFLEIPIIYLSALLRSDLRWEFKWWHRKSNPNKWETYDIQMISTYAPYSDIMLIDWKKAKRMQQNPLQSKVRKAKINTEFYWTHPQWLSDFLNKLQIMKDNAPKQHYTIRKVLYEQ